MRKLALFLALGIGLFLLLISCAAPPEPPVNKMAAQAETLLLSSTGPDLVIPSVKIEPLTPQLPEEEGENLVSLVNDSFLNRYVVALDVATGGKDQFIFEDSTELKTEELVNFFYYAVTQEAQVAGKDPGAQWLKNKKYVIPVNDINLVLARYFGDFPTLEQKAIPSYSTKEGAIVLEKFPVPDGQRYVRVGSRKQEDGKLIVTVDFYKTAECTTLLYSKTYTLERLGESFRYLSITKQTLI